MTLRFQTVRRTTQGLFFLAFILIPFLNTREFYAVAGNLLGLKVAAIPFADPLSMAQAALGSWDLTRDMLVGAGLSLLLAVILGPVFCSWICPYGLLSELVHKTRHPAGPARQNGTTLHPFMTRCLIVCLGIVAIISAVPFPVLNQLSLPGWITRFWQSLFIFPAIVWAGLAAPLLVLAVEALSRKRLWCRYLCPQSVLLALAGLAVPQRLRVSFRPRQCTCPASDRACRKACSLDLNPRQYSLAQKTQCTNCGDCIDACKNRGQALTFRLGSNIKP